MTQSHDPISRRDKTAVLAPQAQYIDDKLCNREQVPHSAHCPEDDCAEDGE